MTLRSLSEEVSDRVLRPETPRWWWIGFGISLALFLLLVVAVSWLFVNGIGVWGVNIPVAWGFAIAEYVWWIALASGGTIISALFYLTRSPWRSATNRIAETMLLAAAACAGIMPILHLGRPGLFYWLFPYPNVMGVWPQVRSPLWWDFVCLLCYILMSIMFYYTGAAARSRDGARPGEDPPASRSSTGILALGWRGSARHWRNHQTVYAHHGGDHGADGDLGAQRRRPRFRRRAHPRLALDAVPALFLFRRGDLRHGAGHHADDPGALGLRAAGHHHRVSSQRARQGHARRQPDAQLCLCLGGVGADLRQRRRRADGVLRAHVRLHAPALSGPKKRSNVVIPQLLWLPFVRRSQILLLLISAGIIVGMWLERYRLRRYRASHHNYMPS